MLWSNTHTRKAGFNSIKLHLKQGGSERGNEGDSTGNVDILTAVSRPWVTVLGN